jgi:hypothetical protein
VHVLRDPSPVLSRVSGPAGVCVVRRFLFLVRCQGFRVVCVLRYGHAVSSLAECSLWELGRRR